MSGLDYGLNALIANQHIKDLTLIDESGLDQILLSFVLIVDTNST